MLKKTLTFKNLSGEKVTRDFYFNYFEHEFLTEYFREDGSTLEETLNEMLDVADGDINKWMFLKFLEDIYGNAVGVPSSDGEVFDKDGQRRKLMQSNAYSSLLWELMQNPQTALNEILEMLPMDRKEEMKKSIKQSGLNTLDLDSMTPDQMRAELAKAKSVQNRPN